MDNEKMDLRQLWQMEAGPTVSMSEGELRKRDDAFSRKVKWRNVREYIAVGACVVVFALVPGPSTTLFLAARLCLIAVCLSIAWHLRKHGSPLPPVAADASFSDALAHHRASLMRQRDLLRVVPVVHVAPIFVACVLFVVAIESSDHPELGFAGILAQHGLMLAYMLGICLAVVAMNLRAAAKLEKKLEALAADSAS